MSPSSLLRIPTMDEMGFPSHTLYSNSWVGGETEALRRLPIYCQLRCHQTTNQVRAEVMIRQTDCVSPSSLLPLSPIASQVDALFDKSSLSPYVRFGCLSVRYFLWKVKWLSKSNPAMERVVKELTTKLLEREFYFIVAAQVREQRQRGEERKGGRWMRLLDLYLLTSSLPPFLLPFLPPFLPPFLLLFQVPNFDMTKNNPICLQMPWECDPLMFQMWKEGRTGYPWIDAAMRQLRKEGWIHHCVRLVEGGRGRCGRRGD